MTAYDFWEALSVRIPPHIMMMMSGRHANRDRARDLESWIHAAEVPIGLLREAEPQRVCRSCGHAINLSCDDHFTY